MYTRTQTQPHTHMPCSLSLSRSRSRSRFIFMTSYESVKKFRRRFECRHQSEERERNFTRRRLQRSSSSGSCFSLVCFLPFARMIIIIVIIIINILRFLMLGHRLFKQSKARGVTLTLDKRFVPSRVAVSCLAAAAAAAASREKNFLFNAFIFYRASVKEIHKILIYHTYAHVCVCVCSEKKSHNKSFVASHTQIAQSSAAAAAAAAAASRCQPT